MVSLKLTFKAQKACAKLGNEERMKNKPLEMQTRYIRGGLREHWQDRHLLWRGSIHCFLTLLYFTLSITWKLLMLKTEFKNPPPYLMWVPFYSKNGSSKNRPPTDCRLPVGVPGPMSKPYFLLIMKWCSFVAHKWVTC